MKHINNIDSPAYSTRLKYPILKARRKREFENFILFGVCSTSSIADPASTKESLEFLGTILSLLLTRKIQSILAEQTRRNLHKPSNFRGGLTPF